MKRRRWYLIGCGLAAVGLGTRVLYATLGTHAGFAAGAEQPGQSTIAVAQAHIAPPQRRTAVTHDGFGLALQRAQAGERAIVATSAGYAVETAGIRARFDTRGAHVALADGSEVHLRATAVSRNDATATALGELELRLGECVDPSVVDANGDCLRRLEGHTVGFTERWESRSEGIEHSIVLDSKPYGSSPLVVTLGVTGASVAVLASGDDAEFGTPSGTLRYSGLLVTDAEGRELDAYLVAASESLLVHVDDADAAYPIVIDPILSTTAGWTVESNLTSAQLGYSVASAGDVNGDTLDDFIVAAPYLSNGQANEGRVYVFYGDAALTVKATAWQVESNLANANFGRSVARAGDINNDGYGDIIVGLAAGARVFMGSSAGLSTTPVSLTVPSVGSSFGSIVASAGDVNGDGFADVIVPSLNNPTSSAYVYYGSATGISASMPTTLSYFGNLAPWTATGIGDVNGDGFGDVAISNPGSTLGGRIDVFHGGATGIGTMSMTTLTGSSGLRVGRG